MSAKNSQFLTNNIILRILEHMSYIKLYAKYSSRQYTYSNIIINNIIFNRPCKALSKYKDFKIFNWKREFIHRFYSKNELYLRLKKICNFYELYSRTFPNYIILYEGRYIYKNIRKKQKMIDAVNKLRYEKNLLKEYQINNNCFDNEIFKGPLFTEEVEYEIAKDNIINNSNYINSESKGDSLFNQSLSIYLKNEINNSQYNKHNVSIESFIANNESNLSLYNIIDILNENRIYVNDLRFLLNNKENIITNNINNNKDKNQRIKQIVIKGNICSNKKNNVGDKELSQDLIKSNKNRNEDCLNDKKINKNINHKKFPSIPTISGKIRKTKKVIKNKDIKDIKNNKDKEISKSNINDKSKSISKDKNKKLNNNKILHQEKNNSKKLVSLKKNINNNYKNNNVQKLKDKLLFLNTNDFSHLQTLPEMENINTNINLLTKNNQNKNKNEKNNQKNKIRNKINKNNTISISNKQNPKQIISIKKIIRYKHMSQDFYSKYNKSKDKDNNSVKKNNFYFYNNLSNKFDMTNSKINKEIINSRSTIGTNKTTNSNKDLSNIKKIKKHTIINNKIIIQNNNNYYLTENNNNNPNLITRTNRNNYDTDDYDTEREKLLTYLKDIVELKTDRCNNNKEISNYNLPLPFTNINTEANNRIDISNSQKNNKIKNGKYLKDLIKKHKTEKKFKKNYKYYFNNVINNSTNFNYPMIKYNTIRKMHYYHRNNSNFTQKLINSISSISKIKKYNSNYSSKTEDYIPHNKDIMKTINCYSHNEEKSKSKYKYSSKNRISNNISNNNNNRKKDKILSKIKTTKIYKNSQKFLQVSDIISSDSSRNILTQRLRKEQPVNKAEMLIIDNNINNKNLTINKIESYKNKRQNTEFKFKTNLTKNKFSSCDFDYSMNNIKNGSCNFSKGLLDRINNIKSKINEGIYKNNQSNLIKKRNNKNILTNRINSDIDPNYKINRLKEKKNIKNMKSQKVYENKIEYNDNKENINIQSQLIKVNKTRYFGNSKSQLYINTDIVDNRYNNTDIVLNNL